MKYGCHIIALDISDALWDGCFTDNLKKGNYVCLQVYLQVLPGE